MGFDGRPLTLVVVGLLLLSSWALPVLCDADAGAGATFTDQWAVHIEGGDAAAERIAQRHGFTNLGKVK